MEPGTAGLPLAVDLDGTLILGDTFFESILAYLGSNPLGAFALAGWFTKGRAFAKAKLAGYAPKADEIPYDQRLLAWLRQEKARGRRLALATATDRKIADDIAAHVGVFDDVFADAIAQPIGVRGEHAGVDRAGAGADDDVERRALGADHPDLRQPLQHACLVGAAGAAAGEDERGARAILGPLAISHGADATTFARRDATPGADGGRGGAEEGD